MSLSLASSGGQAPLVWSAGGLPSGLTVNTSTGTISGTPGTAGSYPVIVKVTDQRGTSASVSFTWTVTSPPAPSSSLYDGVVLADNPLGYWRLGETGGPTAADSSGNGWHGAYLGAPVFGRTGALTRNPDTSVSLTGTNAGVSAPDRHDFVGTAPFSVEAWVRPQNLGASSDYKTIVRKYGSGGGYWFWVNSIEGFGFQRMSSTGSSKVAAGPSTTGVWLHLVATFDGAALRLYVNGAPRGSAGSAFALSDTTATVDIGIHNSLPGNSMNGDLDDVAIYGTALSAARVAAHYQKGLNG